MDAGGAGHVRGFRAPRADEAEPVVAAQPPGATAVQTDVLKAGPPGRKRRQRRQLDQRWLLAAAAGVLVVALVIIGVLSFRLGSDSAASTDQASRTPTPKPSTTALPVTDVYRQVAPSVVLITTSKGSLGSGTIITATGTVLTAHHVIAGGGTISILFADGTKAAATVASASPKIDTATLTPKKLPEVVVPAALGGGVVVGADVVAIGNPLGLRDSTTTGIVSGLGRTSTTKSGPGKATSLTGLIQFDAAVNPGSSGGPLLSNQGVVVGVVVSIADPGGDDAFAGIGFAVPIGAALAGGGDGPGQGRGPQL